MKKTIVSIAATGAILLSLAACSSEEASPQETGTAANQSEESTTDPAPETEEPAVDPDTAIANTIQGFAVSIFEYEDSTAFENVFSDEVMMTGELEVTPEIEELLHPTLQYLYTGNLTDEEYQEVVFGLAMVVGISSTLAAESPEELEAAIEEATITPEDIVIEYNDDQTAATVYPVESNNEADAFPLVLHEGEWLIDATTIATTYSAEETN